MLEQLPVDIVVEILQYLSTADWSSLTRCSKLINQSVSNDRIWKQLVLDWVTLKKDDELQVNILAWEELLKHNNSDQESGVPKIGTWRQKFAHIRSNTCASCGMYKPEGISTYYALFHDHKKGAEFAPKSRISRTDQPDILKLGASSKRYKYIKKPQPMCGVYTPHVFEDSGVVLCDLNCLKLPQTFDYWNFVWNVRESQKSDLNKFGKKKYKKVEIQPELLYFRTLQVFGSRSKIHDKGFQAKNEQLCRPYEMAGGVMKANAITYKMILRILSSPHLPKDVVSELNLLWTKFLTTCDESVLEQFRSKIYSRVKAERIEEITACAKEDGLDINFVSQTAQYDEFIRQGGNPKLIMTILSRQQSNKRKRQVNQHLTEMKESRNKEKAVEKKEEGPVQNRTQGKRIMKRKISDFDLDKVLEDE